MNRIISNFTNFHGRADRSEFWTFALFAFLFWIVAGIFRGMALVSIHTGMGGADFNWPGLVFLLVFFIVPGFHRAAPARHRALRLLVASGPAAPGRP